MTANVQLASGLPDYLRGITLLKVHKNKEIITEAMIFGRFTNWVKSFRAPDLRRISSGVFTPIQSILQFHT